MDADHRNGRVAAVVGIAAVVGAWVLVVVGSSRQAGYDSARDRISPIAAHGAESAWIGILAVLLLAVGYLAAALVLRTYESAALGFDLLVVASVATAVVALARLDCPAGATGCARNEGDNRLIGPAADNLEGLIHSGAVIVAYAFVAGTMALLAVRWWRRGERLPAALSACAFVTSLATVPFWTAGDYPGLVQRIWLGILSAWVVLICARPLIGGARRERT